MRSHLAKALLLSLLGSVVACGGSQPPAPAAPSTAAAPPAAPPPAAPSASTAPAGSTSAAPPEPTPEEKKKAEALERLKEARAKWEKENEAEQARWTPELHSAAKALASKAYPNGRAAIRAAMAGQERRPGDADRDKYRHPLETLTFLGFQPNMRVLDIFPGTGWYTELLAPALAAKGKLLAATPDPNGPPDQRRTLVGQRFRAILDTAPELYGKVQTVVVDANAPALHVDAPVDMVLVMREVHGMVNDGTLDTWLAQISQVLKPGGILGIEEHRAKADADPVESSKKGYVPEKWLIDHVVSAGFKLAAKSEVNANPKDTKDYPGGVWTLPPTLALGDSDRAKYAAIGESDRMTLKFVKAPPTTKK